MTPPQTSLGSLTCNRQTLVSSFFSPLVAPDATGRDKLLANNAPVVAKDPEEVVAEPGRGAVSTLGSPPHQHPQN
jgi:hypothetical protein